MPTHNDILMTIRFLLFFSLCFASCSPVTHQKYPSSKIDTSHIDTTISKTNQFNSSDTFIKNSIDTETYPHLPYYNTSMFHEGPKGYVDTFTIHNYKFRIVHQDTMFDGVVERYENGNWHRTIQFENLGNHNDYDISLDLDGDGFRDLIFYWKWYGEIHFFDTSKNEFCDTANCNIGRDWTLIDTAKHIFFEDDFGKLMDSPVFSNLMTFKKSKRIDIARLEVNFEARNEDQNISDCNLLLDGQDKPVEKFIPKDKVDVALFDYQKFWEERYKKLIK